MRKSNLIGFEHMIDLLDKLSMEAWKKIPNWPPYNVKKEDENHYVIEMAVAGFGSSDLDLTLDGGNLVIRGEIKPDPSATYLHKGIAERAFQQVFPLAESIVVKNASLVNGMLKVWLEHIIPEDKKPRKIEVKEDVTGNLLEKKGA